MDHTPFQRERASDEGTNRILPNVTCFTLAHTAPDLNSTEASPVPYQKLNETTKRQKKKSSSGK